MTVLASPLAAPKRVLRTAALGWLAAQTAALWPHGQWAAARMQDRSDDPLGLAAVALLAVLVFRHRYTLRAMPNRRWLAAAGALTVFATVALAWVPPLLAAVMAAMALAASLVAWLAPTAPRLAIVGLVMLALPWMASLQFYAGYPLRLITAQLSTWALQLAGFDAARRGASMTVQGQLVIVDAPCSGVQMVWMAYFSACAVAALTGLRDAALLRRLPLVGAVVLLGNAARNTVLVALESRPQGLASASHEAIGLLALAGVVSFVVVWTLKGANRHDVAH